MKGAYGQGLVAAKDARSIGFVIAISHGIFTNRSNDHTVSNSIVGTERCVYCFAGVVVTFWKYTSI